MEHGIGGLQVVLQIGDQIGRKEESEPSFREKTQRVIMGIKKLRADGLPIMPALEEAHDLIRLASVEAALEEFVPWMLDLGEHFADVVNDSFSVTHPITRFIALLGGAFRGAKDSAGPSVPLPCAVSG